MRQDGIWKCPTVKYRPLTGTATVGRIGEFNVQTARSNTCGPAKPGVYLILASRVHRALPIYYGWVVVGAAGTAVFARMAPNITTLTVFIYPLSQEFGWSRTLISGAVSAGALSALVLSPAIGWAIDRFGVRPVLTISMVVLGISLTSLAWATVPVAFYLAYATARVVFHVPAPIGSTTVAARWFINARGRAIGIIFLCGALGGLVFTMQSALVIDHFGIRMAWISLGIVVLVVAVAPQVFLIVERPEVMSLNPDNQLMRNTSEYGPPFSNRRLPSHSLNEAWQLSDALKTRSFWMLLLMGSAMFCVNTGISTHVGAYYRDQGLTLTVAASAISFGWLIAAVGSVAWGWVLDRLPARMVYSLVFIFLGTMSVYILSVDTPEEAFVEAFFIGIVSSGSNLAISVIYADYFGETSLGKIRSIGETGVLIGQSAGPFIAGLIFDTSGSYTSAFILFAGVGFLCSMLVLIAAPPVREKLCGQLDYGRGTLANREK